jgi:hypothetical protein
MRRLLKEVLLNLEVTSTGTGELRIRFSQFGILLMEYTESAGSSENTRDKKSHSA